jgi:predicted PurR-regulated permease PerM
MMKFRPSYKKLLIAALVLAVIVVVILKVPIFLDLFGVILISFIIAYSLRPFYKLFTKRGINKKLSAILVITIIILAIVVIFIILIPSIYKEGTNISNTINEIKNYFARFSMDKFEFTKNEFVKEVLNNLFLKVRTSIQTIITETINTTISIGENILLIFIVPTLVYFFLCDDEKILNGIIRFVPMESRNVVRRALVHIDKVLGRYIITQFELCGIVGVLTYIILIFTGVKFAFALAMINAIFNIIPYFGPLIGAIPIIILASFTSIQKAIWVAIWLNLVQQIEGNVVGPKMMGDSVSSHPLTILLLLLIGGSLGGIIGMIVVVPIWVMIKILYEDLDYYLF